MKVIFLNCWYAKEKKSLYKFFQKQKFDTDIFCFSEVQPEFYFNLEKTLSEFCGLYTKNSKKESLGYIYGQAIFIKKPYKILSQTRIDIYRNVFNDVGFAQYFNFSKDSKLVHVINIHGKSRPGHKLDTPARIRQSFKIINFFKDKKGPKIIGGDFNLMPNTKSIKLFEQNGYSNLIKRFGIKDTRGKINHEIHKNKTIQHFADYCFVSEDIKVKNFAVPDVEISDHLPQILEFEV